MLIIHCSVTSGLAGLHDSLVQPLEIHGLQRVAKGKEKHRIQDGGFCTPAVRFGLPMSTVYHGSIPGICLRCCHPLFRGRTIVGRMSLCQVAQAQSFENSKLASSSRRVTTKTSCGIAPAPWATRSSSSMIPAETKPGPLTQRVGSGSCCTSHTPRPSRSSFREVLAGTYGVLRVWLRISSTTSM